VRARPRTVAVVLAAALTLAGCSSGTGQAGAGAAVPARRTAGAAVGAAGPSAAPGSTPLTSPSASPQPGATGAQIIRTATLSVRVRDVTAALATARSTAEDSGGYVGRESTRRTVDARMVSTVVLRVPQASYDTVLARLSGTGTLLSRSSNAEDVTNQVVDVNSRVSSQRASIARIRALMKQARDLSDVVSLESELTTRESALESLLAQQASLRNRTVYATITLDLSETAGQHATTRHPPGITDALAGGWHAFVAVLRWIVLVIGAAAPFLAAAALGLLLWRLVRRGRTGVRSAQAQEGSPAPARNAATATGDGQDEQRAQDKRG
jgi:hypothetical protein